MDEGKPRETDPALRRRLENLTVEVLVAVRDAYVRAQDGRPPMDYWTRLETRVARATMSSRTASEWLTRLQSSLQIESLVSSTCSGLVLEMISFCDENDLNRTFLRACEREKAKLLALTRRVVDHRKEAREAAGESFVGSVLKQGEES